MPEFRILVVDDTPSIHDDFRKVLCSSLPSQTTTLDLAAALFPGSTPAATPSPHFRVDSAMQGQEGLQMVEAACAAGNPYAVAFVDMRMPPGWDGLETIARLWKVDPELQVVICTAYSDHSWSAITQRLGHSGRLLILKKPFDHIEALQITHALTDKWAITRRDRSRLADMDEMVRQRTEELREAEQRFAGAFNASPLAQSIQDLETGTILEINAAHEKMFGLPRAATVDHSPDDSQHGLSSERWWRLIGRLRAGEKIDDWPLVFQPPGQRPKDLRCSGRAVTINGRLCAVWVTRDVTEHTQLEQQLRQAQKMEAVGQLASGVAHDFNNLLTVIMSYSGLALEDGSLPEAHRDGLNQISSAAHRAAALTRQLLLFSRRQICNPEPVDLSVSIATLHGMLMRLMPERIRIQWECPHDLPFVRADSANLDQAVINLVVNARDAITGEGTISIALAAVTFETASPVGHPDARPGSFVRLTIADTGKGIDPTLLAHIFEPFFTTKENGRGSGLGLSIVYGIVRQHEGWIEVDSVLRQGTTFSIYLPTMPTPAPTPAPSETAARPAERVYAGRRRLLLVEDDPLVRRTAAAIASRAGYAVTESVDGPSALEAWAAASEPFDLLLTDMQMPNGITGSELALKLIALHPALTVIISTGYSSELLKQRDPALATARLLLKPYTAADLFTTLQEAASAVAPSPPTS